MTANNRTEYMKRYYQNDPAFRLRDLASKAIRTGLFLAGASKNKSSILQYLSYTFKFKIYHILLSSKQNLVKGAR